MISEFGSHGRRTRISSVLRLAQFVMRKAEVVRAANQVHPCVQSLDAAGPMPTVACQTGEAFPYGAVQAFNERRIEHVPPTGELEQFLSLIEQPMSHFTGDLHDPLFLRSLDHRSNVQLRPHPQACSPNPAGLFDFFTKGASNAARIGRQPSVKTSKGRSVW